MIYSDFKGLKLSKLGFGTMRLPILDNDYSKIDKDETRKMFKLAFDSGVNYFDTAWMYHDHTSEDAVGEILREYPRDSFYIASKFPGFKKEDFDKIDEIFNIQLKKLGLGYFDFYLMHDICEENIELYMEDYNNVIEYLLKKKEEGIIKHLGISTHANLDNMKRFLDKYHDLIEFVQIQLNYLDYSFQKASIKVDMINSYNLPIWVMEPVRGGKLSDLGEYNHYFKDLKPNDSISSWGFRFNQSIEGVKVILSGMSNMEQTLDNLKTFEKENTLSKDEFNLCLKVADLIIKQNVIPCTKCNYCKSVCPRNISINEIFELYNEFQLSNRKVLKEGWFNSIAKDTMPKMCIKCHKCECICPQQIKITSKLEEINDRISYE